MSESAVEHTREQLMHPWFRPLWKLIVCYYSGRASLRFIEGKWRIYLEVIEGEYSELGSGPTLKEALFAVLSDLWEEAGEES